MCGPSSRFKESQQEVIELKDDDPTAVEAVLRHLYNFEYGVGRILHEFTAKDHMNVFITAQKYLLEELKQEALRCLDFRIRMIVADCSQHGDASRLWDVLNLLADHVEHHPTFLERIGSLTKAHLPELFKLKEFRSSLEYESSAEHLDLCIKAIKHGYSPSKRQGKAQKRFFRCMCCDAMWTSAKLYFCPDCGNAKQERLRVEWR